MGILRHTILEHTEHLQTPHLHGVEVCYCPRCHHQVRFQQALSDGAWVCQKCLRFRTRAVVSADPTECERAAGGSTRPVW